jgi:hypothetical protein
MDDEPQVSPTILSPLLFISHCGMNRWILPVAFLISRKSIIVLNKKKISKIREMKPFMVEEEEIEKDNNEESKKENSLIEEGIKDELNIPCCTRYRSGE